MRLISSRDSRAYLIHIPGTVVESHAPMSIGAMAQMPAIANYAL